MKPDEKINSAYVKAVAARQQAYAPYSKFEVGAALVTSSGKVYTGSNVENASYGATICAERVAILKAVSEGERNFSDIVVVTNLQKPAGPCALCLQLLAEFCEPKMNIWIANTNGIKMVKEFSELLPFPFGPRQLHPV
jgi:cytidine deaminase